MYVLVTGLPASGKSTLAKAPAAELRLPLLGKDPVKETLADVLGAGGPSDVEWSSRLGPVLHADTRTPVDTAALAAAIRAAARAAPLSVSAAPPPTAR
jgi:hypothetical protein